MTSVFAATTDVVIVNDALLEPAGMSKFGRTTATGELDELAMEMPPAGAGPFRCTVNVLDVPPTIADDPGNVNSMNFGATTKRPSLTVLPLSDA